MKIADTRRAERTAPVRGARPAGRVADVLLGVLGGMTGGWLVFGAPETFGGERAEVLQALVLVTALGGIGLLLLRQSRRQARRRDAELAGLSWRLDFALAASGIGVWDVDLATDELIWDDRARMIFGVPERKGFFGEADWVSALHPDDRARAMAEAHAAISENARFVSDYRVVLPSGEIRHIRDMAATYRGPDGSHRLVGLVWDVTTDVRRQDELETRKREAEAATLAKSQFLAAMSHEIRTPMTGVLGMLDLMLADRLPDAQRERARLAHAAARGLLTILNDILDFSKLEARRLELHPKPVDVRAMVEELLALADVTASHKDLVLDFEVAAGFPALLSIDPDRFRQIVTNLLSNAIRFTDAGSVMLRLGWWEREGGLLSLEVADTGVGMSQATLARVFDEFYQAEHELSRRRGGTGLGLAISRQLVELMGGEIAVHSEPGVGSAFTLTLPARPVEGSTSPGVVGGAEPESEGPLVLLVAEDNATIRHMLRYYLEARGHRVTTVETGAEAVAAVQQGAFDAVIMDVQMPQMDGPTATRAIRTMPGAVGRVPIIALTANALPGDRETYLAAGMSDYLAKPVDFEALRAVLGRIAASRAVAE